MNKTTDHCIINGKLSQYVEEEIEKLFPNHYAYEVIRILNTQPLLFLQHYQRFENTCQKAGYGMLPKREVLEQEILDLIKIDQLDNTNIKIVVTGELRVVFSIPAVYPTQQEYREGVLCRLLFEERKNPKLKIYQAELRQKADAKKAEKHVFESLLVNKQGFITEGSKSNIFFIKGRDLYTAPDDMVLSGVTRQKVIEICADLSLKIHTQPVHYKDIDTYEAAFICGTSPGVLAVNAIEDIALQASHPLIRQIHQLYSLSCTNGYQ